MERNGSQDINVARSREFSRGPRELSLYEREGAIRVVKLAGGADATRKKTVIRVRDLPKS